MLLATDRNGEHNKAGMVMLYLHPTAGHAALPGLNVTGDQSQPAHRQTHEMVTHHSIPLPCSEPQTWPMPAQRLAGPAWSMLHSRITVLSVCDTKIWHQRAGEADASLSAS